MRKNHILFGSTNIGKLTRLIKKYGMLRQEKHHCKSLAGNSEPTTIDHRQVSKQEVPSEEK